MAASSQRSHRVAHIRVSRHAAAYVSGWQRRTRSAPGRAHLLRQAVREPAMLPPRTLVTLCDDKILQSHASGHY